MWQPEGRSWLNSRLNRESTERTNRAVNKTTTSIGSIHGSTERALKDVLRPQDNRIAGGSIHGSTERALKVAWRICMRARRRGLNSRLNRESTESPPSKRQQKRVRRGSIHGSTERALKDTIVLRSIFLIKGSIHGSTERALKVPCARHIGTSSADYGSIHGSTERALKVNSERRTAAVSAGLNSRLNRESTERAARGPGSGPDAPAQFTAQQREH